MAYFQKLTKPGMYKVLSYYSTLEILDPKGKEAVFHKTGVILFDWIRMDPQPLLNTKDNFRPNADV